MTGRILIVEDEPGLVRTLTDRLALEGLQVCSVENGAEASLRLGRECFDLVILDLMLPGKNGIEICRDMRRVGDRTLVLMLTARSGVEDRIAGLEGGADDYLAKPFEMRELVARVRALLRRPAVAGRQERDGRVEFGPFSLDLESRELCRSGRQVELTSREGHLLCYLAEREGVAVSRRELLREVWGYRGIPRSRTVDVHMAQLRKKVEVDPRRPRYLVTVQREGYRFVGSGEPRARPRG